MIDIGIIARDKITKFEGKIIGIIKQPEFPYKYAILKSIEPTPVNELGLLKHITMNIPIERLEEVINMPRNTKEKHEE